MHLDQTASDTLYVGLATILADPADSSVAVNYADELFEEIFTGHNEIDQADWLGIPIAGQPSDIELVEDFHVPAEVDREMAATPADSDTAIPAAEEEMQCMLYPR
eukprot:3547657-Pyramimonas_sp.AAC.1